VQNARLHEKQSMQNISYASVTRSEYYQINISFVRRSNPDLFGSLRATVHAQFALDGLENRPPVCAILICDVETTLSNFFKANMKPDDKAAIFPEPQ
jgi:hypothetical protein